MTTLRGKSALVIGASSGTGKSTAAALAGQGVRVTAVARDAERLKAGIASLGNVGSEIEIVSGDAANEDFASKLLRDRSPDLIAMVGGNRVSSAPFTEYSWETFSEAWNNDMQSTFHLLKAAHTLPLRPGSRIVVVSSGAAINGSPISGGYAGAKRMQWLLAGYAQKFSDQKNLGIRTITIVPRQLIEGTAIAERAASVYGAMEGLTAESYMRKFQKPLTTDMVANAIVEALRGDLAAGVGTVGVNGEGVEPLG